MVAVSKRPAHAHTSASTSKSYISRRIDQLQQKYEKHPQARQLTTSTTSTTSAVIHKDPVINSLGIEERINESNERLAKYGTGRELDPVKMKEIQKRVYGLNNEFMKSYIVNGKLNPDAMYRYRQEMKKIVEASNGNYELIMNVLNEAGGETMSYSTYAPPYLQNLFSSPATQRTAAELLASGVVPPPSTGSYLSELPSDYRDTHDSLFESSDDDGDLSETTRKVLKDVEEMKKKLESGKVDEKTLQQASKAMKQLQRRYRNSSNRTVRYNPLLEELKLDASLQDTLSLTDDPLEQYSVTHTIRPRVTVHSKELTDAATQTDQMPEKVLINSAIQINPKQEEQLKGSAIQVGPMQEREVKETAIQTIPKQETNNDPSKSPLIPLLGTLRNKPPLAPMSSIMNAATIDLLCEFLNTKNYVNLGTQLVAAEDVECLLDFIVHLLHNGVLRNTSRDASRKARRLMLKLFTMAKVTPRSLYLSTNVVLENQDYVARGGFANIFIGNCNGMRVALKQLYNIQHDLDFAREALIWRSLSHEYVLPFFGIHEDQSESFISLVSPYMEKGTLTQWRRDSDPPVVEIEKRMLEVAEGVQYLHSEGVIHGDLRGNNILLDSHMHVKIADFGLTRHSDATATKTLALSPNFSAPELLEMFDDLDDDDEESGDEAVDTLLRTEKTDVYAFACLYYEVHFDKVPFQGLNDIAVFKQVRNGRRAPRLKDPKMDNKAWKLIQRCWKADPNRRPTMEDAVEMMLGWQSPS
ncbi:hypothetical protein AX17_005151 [Amanita inopinata Kibby_2008]|nr:hypothetical protein AX17_005151 [Amanita inopinata Kibby_2008]